MSTPRIIAVLAPLYWIYDGPQDLLVAQGVLFALAVPQLWSFTGRICAAPISGAPGAATPGLRRAGGLLLGLLVARRQCPVLLWGPAATSAAWIVAQAHYTYPFRSLAGQRAQIGDLERRGYQVPFRRDGYLVLHRPPGIQVVPGADAPGPDARALAWGAWRPM